jgi:predicted GNAT superfamily acetyltransferase
MSGRNGRPDASLSYRSLATPADYAACLALQRETWGESFVDVVPPAVQKVAQKIGGVAAGAFDEAGRLGGFVFGLTGVRHGRLVHWSDMLAVRPELRGRGVGLALKLFQRELLLPLGVEEVLWTFDPLVARNAHLNFAKLGVTAAEYVVDMYGEAGETSAFATGLGTDRFIVSWAIADARVARILHGAPAFDPAPFAHAPIINAIAGPDGLPRPIEALVDFPPRARIEIPPDIHAPECANERPLWRRSTRAVFTRLEGARMRIAGFHRDPRVARSYYCIERG